MERYRTTIIMAVALIVLGGVALFLNNRNATSPGTATPTPVTYIWEEANPVSAIEVVSGTGKVQLTKDPVLGTWAITEPIQKPADLFAVSGVADSLQKPQAMFALTGTADLSQYGLTPNPIVVTVTFSDTQHTTHTLNIGTTTPDGSGYYVSTPGSTTVYVVANTTIEPMRTWLTTPPVEQPSPTPVPITIVPTETSTPTVPPNSTGTVGPQATATPTVQTTPLAATPSP
jgi:hypothetical protein